jgi:hypothetical protein
MRLRRESLFLYGVLLRIGRGKFLCDGRGLHEPRQQSEDQRPGEIKDDEGCSNHCVEARIPRQNIFIYIIDMERNNRPALPTWPVSPYVRRRKIRRTSARALEKRRPATVVFWVVQPGLKTEIELRIMAE